MHACMHQDLPDSILAADVSRQWLTPWAVPPVPWCVFRPTRKRIRQINSLEQLFRVSAAAAAATVLFRFLNTAACCASAALQI